MKFFSLSPIFPFFFTAVAGAEDSPPGKPPPAEKTSESGKPAGESFLQPFLSPGKTDFLYRQTSSSDEYNFFVWAPVFRGGLGAADLERGSDANFAGGYVRPLLPFPNWGDLILGGLAVDQEGKDADEFQGEYRSPLGLGLGGGFVRRENNDLDVAFGKIAYRGQVKAWSYIVELQAQEEGSRTSPGGYGGIYNDIVMVTFGHDGEQYRTALGINFPDKGWPVRPAFEVLYTDNAAGENNGPRIWFVNATLKYSGGFLSHPARLGRVMGPTGVEFGNPLGFLATTWNRRLDVWELGGLVDCRYIQIDLPNRTRTRDFEALIFPFQFFRPLKPLDYLFVGGSYSERPRPAEDSAGILAGFIGKILFLQAVLNVKYEFETEEKTITLGLIHEM